MGNFREQNWGFSESAVTTPKRPSKPPAVSTVHRLLTNPYYKGDVVYRGTRYKGNRLFPVEGVVALPC